MCRKPAMTVLKIKKEKKKKKEERRREEERRKKRREEERRGEKRKKKRKPLDFILQVTRSQGQPLSCRRLRVANCLRLVLRIELPSKHLLYGT